MNKIRLNILPDNTKIFSAIEEIPVGIAHIAKASTLKLTLAPNAKIVVNLAFVKVTVFTAAWTSHMAAKLSKTSGEIRPSF